ncbi:MAG TPA: phosphoserine transaminase, partial [Alphaproteobacteria bacterium]|nr:phosphoserine transaminase [Alphaproteobacteria bacterium]
KHPGWSFENLKNAALGRSHRAQPAKGKLKQAIEETKALLELPKDYIVGIMAASDTGAVEAALWSLLGPRPVDVFAWESFGKDWVTDCVKQLKPLEVRSFVGDFGVLPDLKQANMDHDIVFTWNGTTSGVIVPNGDWISADRKGLTICDATSSACAVPMPWDKLDVVTFSWQKVLGGEAQHGILILSPRAIERLESHKPSWPVPKIFRMTKDGKLNKGIFEGETINTPSMMCVEDALSALNWARSVGGSKGLSQRTKANYAALGGWVEKSSWVTFLPQDAGTRSPTSVCLKPKDPAVAALSKDDQAAFFKKITGMLEAEKVAFDINSYRDAPPGLRIWCGATVEAKDLEALTAWLDWAYAVCRAELKAAA